MWKRVLIALCLAAAPLPLGAEGPGNAADGGVPGESDVVGTGHPAPAAAALPRTATVRFTETVTLDGRQFQVPVVLGMETTGETGLALTLRGDLGTVQAALPALLSQVIEDECDRTTALALRDVTAVRNRIRLSGQLQARRYVCLGEPETRAEVLDQTAEVEVVLRGLLRDGCLAMRVVRAEIRPDGLTGALLDATGMTTRLTRDLRARVEEEFAAGENCIDLPEEFRAFGTEITGGRFEEIGEGRLGAVVEGRMEVTAAGVVDLIVLLGRKGKLGE